MIIGIPTELKNNENRVSLTPAGVKELIKKNNKVVVQEGAGNKSGFYDKDYIEAGAKILNDIKDVYQAAELIVKVKEPVELEYQYFKKHHIVFTFFHFASEKNLTLAMLKSGATCIAYETVEDGIHNLPLLIPMSEVAGRMAVQEGAKYLEKPEKGKGVLLGGVPGVEGGKVLILGGGVVGTQAAKVAAGLGAQVTIMDINIDRLRTLSDIMPANVITLFSNEYNIRKNIKSHDLIIGAVLIPGAKAPLLISKDMLAEMQAGTVLIDVAVDQGGCIETCKPTTHQKPTYMVKGILHYCVTNMPGAVPYTSTLALTNATLPYIIRLSTLGWKEAMKSDIGFKQGLNLYNHKVVHQGVADAFNLPCEKITF